MDFEFLRPVDQELLDEIVSLESHNLGSQIRIHTQDGGFPDLEGVNVAIVSVHENRLAGDYEDEFLNFNKVRRSFYGLFPGNWDLNIADLGSIEKGEIVEDTYFALQSLVKGLLKQNIIPIILGGSQDLIYAQYRAYDFVEQMVNL
ncbi:MAG TPA: hypothetical protein VK833_04850, partial [Gillisia sp.]|nr:hypothetical protein [Gillisia sp.]